MRKAKRRITPTQKLKNRISELEMEVLELYEKIGEKDEKIADLETKLHHLGFECRSNIERDSGCISRLESKIIERDKENHDLKVKLEVLLKIVYDAIEG